MRRAIIGFTGPIDSGKTEAAKVCEQQGFKRIRFAGPLKDMAKAFGLSPAQVDGDQKEVPSDLICGQTPRYFMQKLGTEFGRELIGDDVWIRAFQHAVNQLDPWTPVVVDDVRFQNEAGIIQHMGGIVVRIDRDGYKPGEHASEQFGFDVDFAIANHSLDAFRRHVSNLADTFRQLCERDAA